MKIAYAFVPLALLAASGFAASSGCGGSLTRGSPDGGPPCQPSCVDAFDEASGDTHVAPHDAAEPGDGGESCMSVCESLSGFSGCPDPGCDVTCSRQEMLCATAAGVAAFDALLACEKTAHYACSTGTPPLPTTHDCDEQASAVAAACPLEAGGTDAGCSMTVSPSDCSECCAGMHTEGADSYGVALTNCACTSPGVCEGPCEDTECMGATPAPGSACGKCLAGAVAPDGGCADALSEACASDPSCVAYEKCLTAYGCATKK